VLLQRIAPTLVATHTYVNPVVAAVAILAAIVLIQQGTRLQREELSAERVA
jgi:hypothetical protein